MNRLTGHREDVVRQRHSGGEVVVRGPDHDVPVGPRIVAAVQPDAVAHTPISTLRQAVWLPRRWGPG